MWWAARRQNHQAVGAINVAHFHFGDGTLLSLPAEISLAQASPENDDIDFVLII